MPENTVYVGRGSRWGNPYRIVTPADAAKAVEAYRKWLLFTPSTLFAFRDPPKVTEIIRDLRGKNLACWCAEGQPCHADILLKIANVPVCQGAALPPSPRI